MAWNLKFWNNKTEKREVVYENPYGFGLGFSNFQGLETMPAISLSAVFSAIELIANSVAELPIDVKTRQANKTTVIPNHPVYHVFENCLQTKYMLVKMLISDMLLYGDGIAYIERAQDGTPLNLIYCPHGTVTINYNERTRQLYYIIPNIRRGKIEPIDVIHILKNSTDGV
jgi:HK97 family phage portal protein